MYSDFATTAELDKLWDEIEEELKDKSDQSPSFPHSLPNTMVSEPSHRNIQKSEEKTSPSLLKTLLQSSATTTITPSPLQTSIKAGKTSMSSLNRKKGGTETESIPSVLKNVPQNTMAAKTSTPFFQRWLFLWHPWHQSWRSIKQVIQGYLLIGKDVFLQFTYWVIKYYWF